MTPSDNHGHTASPVKEKEIVADIPMEEEGSHKVKEFTPSKGLTSKQAEELLEQWGRNELSEKKKPKVSFLAVILPCSNLNLFSRSG